MVSDRHQTTCKRELKPYYLALIAEIILGAGDAETLETTIRIFAADLIIMITRQLPQVASPGMTVLVDYR